ncbi:MAG: YeeE/YedE thiosulfate transporter family protein [Methylotenera sp.]|nr:YeeE/YedE thiosulfate transporter family protein [Methylotenera sp.]
MLIDWNNFTPWTALTGGALIGISAALFILINGRIAGITGIIGGLFRPVMHDVGWRIAFTAGLIIAPVIWLLFAALPEIKIDASYGLLAFAGLIVGFGARLGSGCTSGHGVCGISRFSPRSIVATLTFMSTGFLTVYVMRHLLGAS